MRNQIGIRIHNTDLNINAVYILRFVQMYIVHTFVFTPGSLQNFFFNIFVVVYTVQGTEKNDFYEKTRAARAFGHL